MNFTERKAIGHRSFFDFSNVYKHLVFLYNKYKKSQKLPGLREVAKAHHTQEVVEIQKGKK